MADSHSKEVRSYNMSRIRSKDTKPEVVVRKYLFSQGLRYRINDNRYPGRPDIVLPKYRTVIFVNGCFWHCHGGCPDFVMPQSNREYWEPKLRKNLQRDRDNHEALKNDGWSVIVLWECDLKKARRDERLKLLFRQITGTGKRPTDSEA